nr:putative ribonuclease H-like domain-containing protein [Tanacetum cinerariifolium]
SNIALITRNKLGIDNLDIDDLYNNLKVYEDDIKGSSGSSLNSQNVAFVSTESTSSTNELNAAYSVSTATGHSSQAQGSSSYAHELMFSFFANQSSSLQLDNKDLKQIDQDDLEEINLKWKSYQVEKEASDFDLLAFTSNSSSSSSLNSEEEVTKTVFNIHSSDEENSLANDRFKKCEGYHAVPPSLTGNYIPPKFDLLFAGLDDSIYKFKISETVTSLTKDEKDDPETSTACVEKPKEDRSTGESVKPIKSVKHVKPIKPVKSVEQIKKSKNFSSSSLVDRKDLNGKMTQKLGLGFGFTKKACFVYGSMSHLIKDYTFHEDRMAKKSVLLNNVGKETGHKESRPVWNNVQRINHQNKFAPTAIFTRFGRIPVSAAKPKVTASTAKPVNIVDLTRQALKKKGIVDSGCSRHITGNKAYLTDYQEINDGGFVAFGSSREKEVSDAADALKKEFKQGCMDQKGVTKAGSTNIFNNVSNPVTTARHCAYDDDLDIFTSPIQSMGVEADFNNMESSTIVSPIPTPKVYVDDIIFGSTKKSLCDEFEALMHKRFQISFIAELTFFLKLQVKQSEEGIFVIHDKFQVTPKLSYIHAEKRIFRYLKGQLKLGLWYIRDYPFDLEAYSDSDYTGANLDRKFTTGGYQFLGRRLILWQWKKKTIVTTTTTTKAEYVATTNYYGKVILNDPTPQEEGPGSGLEHQKIMGGAMAYIGSEGALIQSIDPPLSTCYTVGSGEDRMEHDIELTDHVPQTPHDSPLLGGHTPGSDEGSMTLKELMDLCTTLLQKVLDLENVKTAQAKEITTGTSKRQILGRRKVSKQGMNKLKSQQMFQDIDHVLDEDFDIKMIVEDKGNGEKRGCTTKTVSTTRPDISAARQKVSTTEPKTPPTTTTLFDDGDVTIVDTLVKMKNQKAKEKRIAFKDADVSARLIRSITTLQPLPTIDPKDKDDDKAIDYENLDVKSPIVDCESQVLGTNEAGDVHVYNLTRLDGSYRHFSTFSRMLEVLDRQDVLDLYKIIIERNQQDWKLLSWKLYETYGVHTLMLDDSSVSINMFVEKKYPLTKEILEKIISLRLEVETKSTLALDLIKVIKLQIEEK